MNFNTIFRLSWINHLFFICHWLAMSNGCWNPFIYALFSVSIYYYFLSSREWKTRASIDQFCPLFLLLLNQISLYQHLHTHKQTPTFTTKIWNVKKLGHIPSCFKYGTTWWQSTELISTRNFNMDYSKTYFCSFNP